MDQAGRDHRAAIDAGHRIMTTIFRPVVQYRLDIAPLDQIVARTAGIVRLKAFRALGVNKDVWLIAPLVDGGTAQLGEPDRLRFRHTAGRVGQLDSRLAVMMGIGPPVPDILVPEGPGLGISTILNRGPDLRVAIRRAGIIPVIALAALDIAAQIGRIVNGCGKRLIKMTIAIAPVRKRRIPVNGNGIDVRMAPQRVQVKEDIARSVLRLVTGIFRPVRRIRKACIFSQQRPRFTGQRLEMRNSWKRVGLSADGGKAAHLRSDQKSVDAAGRRRNRRMVQDKAAKSPFRRPGIDDGLMADVEVRRTGRAEKSIDLLGRNGTTVHAVRLARCRVTRDPSAPGKGRLLRAAIRVCRTVF